jgi:8-oxo-dGTP pyrophosphatase MutT (NUDIX family)
VSGGKRARELAPALEAATIVLARDGPAGLEVVLLERHARSRMAPGAFAFPGGRLEAADVPADAHGLCRGLAAGDAARILRDVEPPQRAIGFWMAVLRELFEETGILLAYGRDGAPFVPDGVALARLGECRTRSRRDGRAFVAMLREEGLTLAADRMAYYAHWITPEERPVRYDTRFFVAAAFEGAEPDPDGVEIVGWRWLGPADALRRHEAGTLTLPFPTRRVLGEIAAHPRVAALLEAARAREVRPIRPRIVVVGGEERFLLPGDPGYF